MFFIVALSVKNFIPFLYYHYLQRQDMIHFEKSVIHQRVYFFAYDLYVISKRHIVRLILFIVAMAMVLFNSYIRLEGIHISNEAFVKTYF